MTSPTRPTASPDTPPRSRRDRGLVAVEPLAEVYGLACWYGPARAMPGAHRHDEIEVNLTGDAPLVYLAAGERVRLPARHVAAFWAAIPHQLLGPAPSLHWVTVPLAAFMRWGLPEATVATLLRGRALVAARDRVRVGQDCFERWAGDLAGESPQMRQAAVLEIEALVRRLGAAASEANAEALPVDDAAAGGETGADAARAGQMAAYIAGRFREPLGVADVAAAVHLHPHYAMTVFRRVTGLTVGAYLTRRRLAEAQRLLLTTDATVDEVALRAGFGSRTRFYATFAAHCGQAPSAYRRGHRAPA